MDRIIIAGKTGRRAFLKLATIGSLTGAGVLGATVTRAQHTVPNSSGTQAPKTKAPANAADCHIHIYDARFKSAVAALPDATVQDYRLFQKRIGTSRVVIVTPRNYVVDNAVTLEAIRQFEGSARGVAVIRPDVTDAELKRMDAGGIRGIRFTVGDPKVAVVSIDMIEPLAKRIADLGWHVQLNMTREQIVENADLLSRLPTQIVFDHLGQLKPPAGIEHPAYGVIRKLIDKGRTWVKLSGAYSNTLIGPPTYADATKVAQEYVKAAPEHLVWGSDWPHPGEAQHKPDDAVLFDLLAVWAPVEATRHRMLVTNPEVLYRF
jgi:predicted TIM-barrel fold metal-dependent hydrolase